MALASADLHLWSDEGTPADLRNWRSVPSADFDYAGARYELNEARERKARADELLKRVLRTDHTFSSPLAAVKDEETAIKAAVDKRIQRVSRALERNTYRTRKAGVRGSPSIGSRIQNRRGTSFTPVSKSAPRKTSTVRPTPRVFEVPAHAPSPGSADRVRAGARGNQALKIRKREFRRSSIRPPELAAIHTTPKPEKQVVRRARRRRKKQATPDIVDMRSKRRSRGVTTTARTRHTRVSPPAASVARKITVFGASRSDTTLASVAVGPDSTAPDDKSLAAGGNITSTKQETMSTAPGTLAATNQEMTVGSSDVAGSDALDLHANGVDNTAPASAAASFPLPAQAPVSIAVQHAAPAPCPAPAVQPPFANSNATAVRQHIHDREIMLMDAEARGARAVEEARRAKECMERERLMRQQLEKELNTAQQNIGSLGTAVDALKEANQALELTNSSLVEQMGLAHGRARLAEKDILRMYKESLTAQGQAAPGRGGISSHRQDAPLPDELIMKLITELVLEDLASADSAGQDENGTVDDEDMRSDGYGTDRFEEEDPEEVALDFTLAVENIDTMAAGSAAPEETSQPAPTKLPDEDIAEIDEDIVRDEPRRALVATMKPISHTTTFLAPRQSSSHRSVSSSRDHLWRQLLEERALRERAEAASEASTERRQLEQKIHDLELAMARQKTTQEQVLRLHGMLDARLDLQAKLDAEATRRQAAEEALERAKRDTAESDRFATMFQTSIGAFLNSARTATPASTNTQPVADPPTATEVAELASEDEGSDEDSERSSQPHGVATQVVVAGGMLGHTFQPRANISLAGVDSLLSDFSDSSGILSTTEESSSNTLDDGSSDSLVVDDSLLHMPDISEVASEDSDSIEASLSLFDSSLLQNIGDSGPVSRRSLTSTAERDSTHLQSLLAMPTDALSRVVGDL